MRRDPAGSNDPRGLHSLGWPLAVVLALSVAAAPLEQVSTASANTPGAGATPADASDLLESWGIPAFSPRALDAFRPARDIEAIRFPQVPLEAQYVSETGVRITPSRIRTYLSGIGSPLATFATQIVRAGIRYDVDPRVVVAIAGVESSFGARAVGFNAWGWGRMRWSSWPHAIDEFTQQLALGYRSLRTGRFHRASRSYCPPCGPRWGRKAASIFRSI